MEKIKNYNRYNEAMTSTMLDKIWFLDKIPPTVDTIVDFGCADGSLIKFIDSIFPNRFKFVGIDNDEEMLDRATKNLANIKSPYTLYHSICGLEYQNMENAVLVLNSVVHEIFSYCSYLDCVQIFNSINKMHFSFVAIRDMHYQETTANELALYTMANVFLANEKEHFTQWNDLNYHSNTQNSIIEFLLKYRYKENWDREVAERYLWNWKNDLTRYFRNYEIEFEQDFYIPFIFSKYELDFDTKTERFNTHKKLLFKCR
jgi:trans-aconitate methyltransferase